MPSLGPLFSMNYAIFTPNYRNSIIFNGYWVPVPGTSPLLDRVDDQRTLCDVSLKILGLVENFVTSQ